MWTDLREFIVPGVREISADAQTANRGVFSVRYIILQTFLGSSEPFVAHKVYLYRSKWESTRNRWP